MIIPLCQKTPADPILGTQWSMWVCLLTWDCLSHYNFHMAYKKMFNLVRWGVELKMNWLNWSIPISSGFQFQFNSNSKSFNSIPIQFMLNWIELIINSNSIHELIRALLLLAHGCSWHHLWVWAQILHGIIRLQLVYDNAQCSCHFAGGYWNITVSYYGNRASIVTGKTPPTIWITCMTRLFTLPWNVATTLTPWCSFKVAWILHVFTGPQNIG